MSIMRLSFSYILGLYCPLRRLDADPMEYSA